MAQYNQPQLDQEINTIPIKLQELCLLENFGVEKTTISFNTVTIESCNCVCVRDPSNNRLLIIDINDISKVVNLQFVCEFAVVNPVNRILAALIKSNKADNLPAYSVNSVGGNTHKFQKILQLFNIVTKSCIKFIYVKDDEEIVLVKWISSNVLSFVTHTAVYHWNIETGVPVKWFERHVNLKNSQIINYRTDCTMKWSVLIGLLGQNNKVIGSMQLYSFDRKCSQYIEGHAACFTKYVVEENTDYSTLFCFIHKNSTNSLTKLHMAEVLIGPPNPNKKSYPKKSLDVFVPPECQNDFPVAMQANEKHSFLYVVTLFAYIYLFEIETGTCVYMNKISSDTIFCTVPNDLDGGIICVNKKGSIFLVSIDENSIVMYVLNVLKNDDLALKIAVRDQRFKSMESLFFDKFNQLFQNESYAAAARIAINAPNEILRTDYILYKFLDADKSSNLLGNPNAVPANNPPPALQYFGLLLDSGKKLNHNESLELCKKVVQQKKIQLLEKWLKDDRICCSEELGDIVNKHDNTLALSVYLRANIPDKVINCFIEAKQYQKIILYCRKINYKPNFVDVLHDIITMDSKGDSNDINDSLALMNSSDATTLGNSTKKNSKSENIINFAKMLIAEFFLDGNDNKRSENINGIVDLFVKYNMVKECTAFLLEVLKENRPNESNLQTKLIEINILSGEIQVADAILSNKMFTHYDKNYVGQLCENYGLFEKALQHYTDVYDIKRALIHTQLLDEEFLMNYFNNLAVEDALECLKSMLSTNIRQNLKICIKICTKYFRELTVKSVIDLFESFKCYEGLYYFLGSILMIDDIKNDDDDLIYFTYLQSACKTGQIKDVERVCREVNFKNPEKVKNYLKEIKLTDQLPLVIICDRFNYVNDLVLYLYRNNLQQYLEIYVVKVNPSRLPEVVGSLLDLDCNEDNIRSLIMNLNIGQFSVDSLVDEIEKRNRLKLLSPWLEMQVLDGSTNEAVHNAIAKIYIDTNNSTERFLKENQYYSSIVIGKYCEKRDPHLACVAYERGKCDEELVSVCYENNLFKLAARYLVRRRDQNLWFKVLVSNEIPVFKNMDTETMDHNHKQLVEQIVQTASSETHDAEEILSMVKAFMAADMPRELIEVLEKILLDNAMFCNHKNLQNLLLLTAIKSDRKKLVDYINRLDKYDTKDVALICVNNELYEEAFIIYKKFNHSTSAIQVLIENIQNLDRACEFAECCNEPAVWSLLGKAQLRHNFIKGGIDSFIRANDPSSYINVVDTAQKSESWNDLVNYLQMANKIIRETYIESELIYAYAKTNRLADMEEFITVPNHADLLKIGDRCFDNEMYEAAKILYDNISHYAKLSVALAKLKEFRDSVDNARKANCTKTWKEICFICLDNNEYRLAQICGLNIVVHADELQGLIDYYENQGRFDELIDLLETALGLERAHMGIFTELSILYAKYKPNKMKEHAELFWYRLNIPKVLKAADEAHLWSVSTFLYNKYEDYDNAVIKTIDHPTETWRENHFKDVITKVSNCELYYKAIRFYYTYKPLLLNDLLITLSNRLDHTKSITLFNELNCLHLIKPYLLSVQTTNNESINEVLNDLLIEDEDYDGLKSSIDVYDNIDNIALAQKLEKHELIEFRRISAYLYKKSNRWVKSIDICKQEKLFKDAIKYASESKNSMIAEDLLYWFMKNNLKEYFSALLFQCYDLIHPDVVIELAWKHNVINYAMPYLIQTVNEFVYKFDKLEENLKKYQEIISNSCDTDDKQLLINSSENQLMLTNHGSKLKF